MDEKDRLLLTCLQSGFPLTRRPFDNWASRIGIDGAELLIRLQRFKKEGILGGIQAVFDPGALRYQGAWVAMRFSPEYLRPGEKVLWQHPGVIYGCERAHAFNLWFFVAMPREHDLELHVRCMGKLSGAEETLFLPVQKVLKGSSLLSAIAPETFREVREHLEERSMRCIPALTSEEIRLIRQLQEPFPLTDEPFRKIAADLGIAEAQVLDGMKTLVGKGCLKRIGSFSKPVPINAPQNSLIIWKIPSEKIERVASDLAGFDGVLYADQRETVSEFPYSLFTMIQAGNASELELTIRRIQDRLGKWPHQELVTVREFKKESIRYFPKEMDAWWLQNRFAVEAALSKSNRQDL